MTHLQLAPGALHTYVPDSYVDERALIIIYRAVKAINRFKLGYQIAWGRPTVITRPANGFPVGGVLLHMDYYTPRKGVLSSLTLMELQTLMSNELQRPVTLTVTRLSGPYMDAAVLCSYLSRAMMTKKFTRVVKRMHGVIGTVSDATPITTYSSVNGVLRPASLIGVHVTTHGRIAAERARPRMTEQSLVVGSLTANEQQVLTTCSNTDVNKKNVYTVKVMLSHRL